MQPTLVSTPAFIPELIPTPRLVHLLCTFWAPFCVFRSFRTSSIFSNVQNLSLSAPDALNETISLGQSVQGVIGLAHGTDKAAEGIDVVLAGDSTAVLVDLGNGDLDRAVVLGLDDAVGSAALARDVAGRESISISAFLRRGRVKVLTGRRSRHGRSPFWLCGRGGLVV